MSSSTERQRLSRLLIVEDDPSQLRTLTGIMRQEGFEVMTASTAAEALEHVERESFGVAIVDFRLPDLSGTQLLERISASNGKIRVIINTGYGSFDSAKEAVNLGAFAYVEKARDPHELVRHVHAAFRSHLDRYAEDLEGAVTLRTSELREQQQVLSNILSNIPYSVFWKDRDSVYLGCNDSFARDMGVATPQDIVGRTDFDLPGKNEETEFYRQCDTRVMTSGEPMLNIEEQALLSDGAQATVLTSKVPLRGRDGEVVGILGIYADITERTRAEKSLRMTMRLNRILLDAMPCVALLLRPRTREIVASNEAAVKVGAVPGARCFSTFGRRSDPCPWCLAPETWAEGKEQHLQVDAIGSCWDAHWIPVSDDLYMHYAFDITDRKRAQEEKEKLEEQLRQSQKMEAVGQLAGGVAHDFNNLLTAILGNAEVLLATLEKDSTALSAESSVQGLRQITHAAKQAAGLTRQLLTFARRQPVCPSLLDLNRIVTEAEQLLRSLVREDIVLETRVAPEIGTILADAGQIEQVIMNLVLNARDALPDGGSMTVECRNETLDDSHVAVHPDATPGPHVMIVVSDDGVGMSAETLSHIFDPFFTTKPVGRGTGLGLSMVYGIVKQAGGHVTVQSELGKGTTFRVYIPRASEAAPSTEPSGSVTHTGGNEVILVCEDQELVRRLTTRILRDEGYFVLEAANGRLAREVADKHCGAIDLLVTDVVMPEMNGRQLAALLSRRHANMRTLFVSGYAADVVAGHGARHDRESFLEKPFHPDDLLLTIRRILDSEKPTGGPPPESRAKVHVD